MAGDAWGADVPVSMPEPTAGILKPLRGLGDGFAFTEGGIHHDLTDVDAEDILPTFAPPIEHLDG